MGRDDGIGAIHLTRQIGDERIVQIDDPAIRHQVHADVASIDLDALMALPQIQVSHSIVFGNIAAGNFGIFKIFLGISGPVLRRPDVVERNIQRITFCGQRRERRMESAV